MEEKRKVPCVQYSRIVGYIAPVKIGDKDHWNIGKAQEFKDRVTFNLNKAISRIGDTDIVGN